jgi:PAS domain S-box-containing protein
MSDNLSKLRRLTNEVDDVFFIMDALLNANDEYFYIACNDDSTIKYLSHNWYSILLYTKGEIIGKSFWDFIHPDDVEKSELAWGILSGVKDFKNRYRTKDGRFITFNWNSVPILHNEKRQFGLGVATIVNEVKGKCRQIKMAGESTNV